MTNDEIVELGIAAQHAKDMFEILSMENTETDHVKRKAQMRRYENARVNMWAAFNRRDAALAKAE